MEMLKDVLKDGIDMDALKDGIDMDALKNGIQEAIKTIALAIDLDTEQISDIFTAKRNTNIKDIVARLHERSQANRARFGA